MIFNVCTRWLFSSCELWPEAWKSLAYRSTSATMCSTTVQRRRFCCCAGAVVALGRVKRYLHQRQLKQNAMQFRDARLWATLPRRPLVADGEMPRDPVASKDGKLAGATES